jgi:hypothetical protein
MGVGMVGYGLGVWWWSLVSFYFLVGLLRCWEVGSGCCEIW